MTGEKRALLFRPAAKHSARCDGSAQMTVRITLALMWPFGPSQSSL